MIQLRTMLKPAGNLGIKKLRVIRVLGNVRQDAATLGDVVIASVIKAMPNSAIKKGEKVRAVIVRTNKEKRRRDGSYIRFDDNAAVILEKDNTPKATRIFGPVAREVKQKGFNTVAAMAREVL
jgi:large subunit ribosomal protein L14